MPDLLQTGGIIGVIKGGQSEAFTIHQRGTVVTARITDAITNRHGVGSDMGVLTVDPQLQHLKDGTVISAAPECAAL